MRFFPVFSDRLTVVVSLLGPRFLALTVVLGLLQLSAQAQAHRIPSATLGLVETGAPSFVVLNAESLGLDSPPTDFHLLPDGRLLIMAAQQLALGDGIRWEVYRHDPTDPVLSSPGGIVDRDGQIYFGVPGGGARVVFGEDGLWRLLKSAAVLTENTSGQSTRQMVTETGNEWIWHSTSGLIVSWRPGQKPRTVGQVDTFEHVFQYAGALYLSDRSEGRLSRLHDGKMEPVLAQGTLSAITCAQPFDKNFMLVGTYGMGLQLFDGLSLRPFPAGNLLSKGIRINDLCTIADGLFAAALDNYGVVFFTRDGSIVQVLDRSLDQRLSEVKRLLPAPGGVIWALLDGSVLRIKYPARISHFEPLMGTGITTIHPYRLNGRLWMIADGKIYTGNYDADGRLTRIEPDSPDQLYVGAFSTATGLPIAGTEQGAYYRSASGWLPFAPAAKNLYLLDPVPVNRRWLYGAKNELGWLQLIENRIEIVQSIPVPGLSKIYNAVSDRQGRIWLELGSGKIGRIHFEHGNPALEILAEAEATPKNWGQIFVLDGTVHFNFAEHIVRFDDALRRFVPDDDFTQSLPGITSIIGRPGLDARGRLWLTAHGLVHILEKEAGQWQAKSPPWAMGFQPYHFTFEAEGVVWMHALHRLARYDPATMEIPPLPLRALITHVNVATSNRSLFTVDRELPALNYSENSLIAHFVASGNSFTTPITFEVQLEGSASEWISAGSAGSAAFSHLKEGHYVLHVRPRAGTEIGAEATLAFSILPPWYRTTIAYVTYSLSALGFVLLAVWLSTLLERRENARLEHLVAERTGELSQSNLQLANQVEEIRILTRAIIQSPIAVFITTPDGTIEFINPRSSDLTGLTALQLIGSNLRELRSPEVTPQTFEEITATLAQGESWSGQLVNRHRDGQLVQVRSTISPISGPDGQTRHLLILEEDITVWLADQQRHRRLEAQLNQAQKMESIGTLAGGIAHDFNNILTGILGYCELANMSAAEQADVRPELEQIRAAGLRAKDLVMQILTFSRQSSASRLPLDLSRPVGEAIKLIRASTPATIEIIQKLESGTILADATQIHQIVVNLCTNAVHAMRDQPGRLEITVQPITVDPQLAAETPNLNPGPCLRLTVADNGQGMDQATLERIFDPFFTTKIQGEGTGLGLSIVQGVVLSHGGALQVSSRLNHGSTFDLYFPRTEERESNPSPTHAPSRGAGQEIMVVDDEPSVADFASSRLQHFGYRPVTFNDPQLAIAAFIYAPERFAAIVTDLTMPQLTGLELITQLRPLRPVLPVVVLTGYGRELMRKKLAQMSHCILLQKPFSGEDLAHALSQVMNQSKSVKNSGLT